MKKPPVIIIINKKPYTLDINNIETINCIPDEDRQQLIQLLEVIKSRGKTTQASTSTIAESFLQPNSQVPNSGSNIRQQANSLERLHSGDTDAIMAQLIMEEELNKKPPPSKKIIQKWMLIVAAIIFVLVLIL